MIKLDIFIFILSFLVAIIAIPIISSLLIRYNCLSLNYQRRNIPIGMGLLFIIIQSVITILTSVALNKALIYVLTYNVCMLLVGLAGFIDDVFGERNVKGFKGHIVSFFKGQITTGFLKAMMGLISAVLFSILIAKNINEIVVNVIVITLFTNLINLFDLRPGRSSKVFIVIAIILLLTSYVNTVSYLIFSMLGILVAYLPLDIKGKVMMGDTGSNVLGITLGIYCAITQVYAVKVIIMIILITFHLLSEFYSISKIITRSRVLSFFDHLGR